MNTPDSPSATVPLVPTPSYRAGEKLVEERRKRRLALIIIATLLWGYGVGTLLRVLFLQSQMSFVDYNRIKDGMSRDRVTAMLGGPPDVITPPTGPDPGSAHADQWDGEEGTIRVGFDDSGRVIWKCYFPPDKIPRRPRLGSLEKLWEALRRVWNLLFL
jgi:hypothetical protein